MNRTLQFKVDWLKLVFLGTALANIWDNAASSPITQLWVSLHSADPGPGNDQSLNEIIYGAYARIAVNRDVTGWTIDTAAATVSPAGIITFPTPTSGTGTISHVGVGRDSTGTGYLMYSGALNPNLTVLTTAPPQLTTASKITASS